MNGQPVGAPQLSVSHITAKWGRLGIAVALDGGEVAGGQATVTLGEVAFVELKQPAPSL